MSLNKFRGNSEITEFDEFQFFTGITTLNSWGQNTLTRFHDMPNLKHIKLPEGVTKIYYRSIYNCPSLEWLTMPATTVDTGQAIVSCPSLRYVILYATTPPIFDSTFQTNNATWILYVPDESVASYKSADGWKTLRIKPISEFDNQTNG